MLMSYVNSMLCKNWILHQDRQVLCQNKRTLIWTMFGVTLKRTNRNAFGCFFSMFSVNEVLQLHHLHQVTCRVVEHGGPLKRSPRLTFTSPSNERGRLLATVGSREIEEVDLWSLDDNELHQNEFQFRSKGRS